MEVNNTPWVPEIEALAKKVAHDPTSRSFIQLADLYLKHHFLEEAIAVLEKGLAFHPTHVAARMMLGRAYREAKRLREAKTTFEKVIEIHPESVAAYKQLALIFREVNRLGDAVQACKTVLTIDPHDKEAETLLTSIQEEILAVDGIERLAASTPASPSQSVAAALDQAATDSLCASASRETGQAPPPLASEGATADLSAPQKEPPVLSLKEKGEETASWKSSSLNLIRLNAWLLSIQEKGKRG